jgi:hypothetical protein|tara:strand:+ start:93 stop:338 length:246 start_codon:yes stop_codon:yes gene_type:complete
MDEKIAKYFLVKVEFETMTDTGKTKKIKSQYLVDAVSCTEAEARMTSYLKDTILDYEIVSAVKSPIEDVVEVSEPAPPTRL